MPARGLNDVYSEGLASCIRTIALAQPGDRLAVFQNMAREAARYVREGGIDTSVYADGFQDAAVAHGLVEAHGQDCIQVIIANALKNPLILNNHAPGSHHWPARSNGQQLENINGAASTLVSRCAAEITPEKGGDKTFTS
jgi:hypothetical protein